MSSMEKAMAPHSSTLAWKNPWTEEPGGLQSMGLWRVRQDWATLLSLSCTGEGNGNPLQCSCLENPRDGWAWWAAVYGAAQSRTRLKRLSSGNSSAILSIVLSRCQLPTFFIFGDFFFGSLFFFFLRNIIGEAKFSKLNKGKKKQKTVFCFTPMSQEK